jgi:hypothetical protein
MNTQIQDQDYIWTSIDQCVFKKQHDQKMKNLITGLCTNHSEEFFNQHIDLIKDSGNDKMLIFWTMCMFNQNLSLIKQMVESEHFKCDPMLITGEGHTPLSLACMHNKNPNVIKYLIEECESDLSHTDYNNSSCLMLASMNQPLNVIEYLIKDCKLNPNHMDALRSTCLSMACGCNPSLSVVKYLMEECKFDPKDCEDAWTNAVNASAYNDNIEIMIYMMESLPGTHVNLDIPSDRWERLVLGLSAMDNYSIFWRTLTHGLLKCCGSEDMGEFEDMDEFRDRVQYRESMKKIIPMLNPMLLTPMSCLFTEHGIQDPMDPMFPMKDFIKLIDGLKCCLPTPVSRPGIIKSEQKQDLGQDLDKDSEDSEDSDDPEIDFMKQTSLVFIHDGNKYYAHSKVVFEQITLFKEIEDMANFDEPVVLSSGSGSVLGSAPRYIINL